MFKEVGECKTSEIKKGMFVYCNELNEATLLKVHGVLQGKDTTLLRISPAREFHNKHTGEIKVSNGHEYTWVVKELNEESASYKEKLDINYDTDPSEVDVIYKG